MLPPRRRGRGAALPQMRRIKRFWLPVGLAFCLTATGAAPRDAHLTRHKSAQSVSLSKSSPSFAVMPHVPTAAALYPMSLNADTRYSYRGRQITTYWRSGHAEAVIISHRAPRLRRIDYLAPDIERGRSVVTDGRQEWQYDPRSRTLLHRRSERDADAVANAAENYDLLRTNYILGVVSEMKMWADRKTFVLTITRKTDRTLARRLWIDAATGLVLKRENYREDGKLAVTVAFSDINFHALMPKTLFDLSSITGRIGVHRVEQNASGETSLPLRAARAQLGGVALVPPTLKGYRLVSAALTKNGGTSLLHLRYSDGLNLVSLFEQRRTHPRRPTRVPASMSPTRIGSRVGHITHRASLTALNWDLPTLNLTLMGEIAEPSLQALALAADPGDRE